MLQKLDLSQKSKQKSAFCALLTRVRRWKSYCGLLGFIHQLASKKNAELEFIALRELRSAKGTAQPISQSVERLCKPIERMRKSLLKESFRGLVGFVYKDKLRMIIL